MNAKELTALYNSLSNEVIEQKKEIDYQKQVIGKLLMRMTDLEIDIKMLQKPKVFEERGRSV